MPMLFFRLIGYKVYYLDCGQWWQKKTILAKLDRIGLIWMSHHEYGGVRGGGVARDHHVQSMRVGATIFALKSYPRLVEVIDQDAVLQTLVYEKVFAAIGGPIELLHSMPQYKSDAKKLKGKVWIPNTIITRSLLDAYPAISNRCPGLWTACELTCDVASRVVGALSVFVVKSVKHFFRDLTGPSENNQPASQSDAPTLEDVEVAYFPHQGVFYSNLFLKDHFYSSEKDSPFFHEKIAHFELNEYLPSDCFKYYRTNNIKNYDWQSLLFDKRAAVRSLIQFLVKALKHRFGGLDLDLLIKQAFIVWSVQISRLRLRNLPNLKIVLIGYDILFPQPLSAACRLAGIKTVAVQERMIAAWWMTPLLVDHYFFIGPEARDYLKANVPARASFYELGPVRLKDHAKACIPGLISSIREKYSSVVLAMDCHSETGWFENGRKFGNNWGSNMLFYEHLLSLCRDFPEAFFLLKGKNTDFAKIPFFKEIVSQFRTQPNLLILEDQDLWTPYSSVASADIGIARHTSLADEMLALGKPIIFDDYDGYPSEIYDYGPEVTAYDYYDIKAKCARFFADPEGYNANLNVLRNKLYSIPAEPLEQVIQKELMAIWSVQGGVSSGMPTGYPQTIQPKIAANPANVKILDKCA